MTLEEAIVLQGKVEKSNIGTDKQYYVGILFDYIQDETSGVEAQITDNFVESNYSIQDHIAIKPRVYRLKGCVGEVVYVNTYKSLNAYNQFKESHPIFQKTMSAINGIGSLSGIVSNYTQAAINIVKQIESSYDRYAQIYHNFRNQINEYRGKRQKVCYDILSYMLKNRIPVSIENLAFDSSEFQKNDYPKLFYLQSVMAHQGDNAFITDIEVTIKEFRIATTKTTKVDFSKFAGYSSSQKTEEANNGLAKGEEVSETVKDTAVNAVKETVLNKFNKYLPLNLVKNFYSSLNKGFNQ